MLQRPAGGQEQVNSYASRWFKIAKMEKFLPSGVGFSSAEDFSSFFDFFWVEVFCLLEKIELNDLIPFFFDLLFFDGEGCLFSSPAAESIEFGS